MVSQGYHSASQYFSGKYWVITSWGRIEERAGRTERLQFFAHYAHHFPQHNPNFHGGPAIDLRLWDNSHMREHEARMSVRLELNALLAALRSPSDERITAVSHALSLRTERRQMFDSAYDENVREILEGLAQYTEYRLAIPQRDLIPHLDAFARGVVQGATLEWAFGYATGMFYALLLNTTDTQWKDTLYPDSDLGQILKEAMGITQLVPVSEIDLSQYNYAYIAHRERQWQEQ
jgi:hypothetical protein